MLEGGDLLRRLPFQLTQLCLLFSSRTRSNNLTNEPVFLPPSVAISGYLLWSQGEHLVLSTHYDRRFITQSDAPDQTIKSYTLGIVSVIGAYYLQSLAFPLIEGGKVKVQELKEHALSRRHSNHFESKDFTVYKQGGHGQYKPPKDFLELAKRVAPPIALRVAASSSSFFCAGIIQTYVALSLATK